MGITNPKDMLKEWCDRQWTEKGDNVLKYVTKEVPGVFCTTVQIAKLKLHCKGDVCRSKKDAEKSAAEKALGHDEVGPP